MTLVQEGVVSQLTIGGTRPDLVLLSVIDWTLMRGVEEGMLWGFVGGIFVDLFSGLPFGTSSAGYVAVAGLVSLGEGALLRTHLLLPLIAAFAGTAVYYAVTVVVVASVNHVLLITASSLTIFLGVAIYNALLNFGLYALVGYFERRLHPVPQASW